jgi:UDP-N-acetylglucosamine acyltransferase
MISGNPAEARSFNLEGLKRRGFSAERIGAVKQMHKLLYRQGLTLDDARKAIDELAQSTPEAAEDVALMSAFLANSTRGIVR